MAGRDDDALRVDGAARSREQPSVAAAFQRLHLDALPHLDALSLRVALEVLDDAVPRPPLPESARDAFVDDVLARYALVSGSPEVFMFYQMDVELVT